MDGAPYMISEFEPSCGTGFVFAKYAYNINLTRVYQQAIS